MDTIKKDFTNEVIDTVSLPRFEEAVLTPLQPAYKKIMLINVAIVYIIIGIAAGAVIYFIEESRDYWPIALLVFVLVIALSILLVTISFKNRGFAFRNHDVIYKSGVLATSTIVIPYNRVQHVALHEGILSRKYGLAAVEVFTAGGDTSDVKIAGIEKDEAERIKQLLVGKILKQDSRDGE